MKSQVGLFFATVCTGIAALMLAAGTAAAQQNLPTVKLGFVFPLTGPVAAYGEMGQRAVTVIVDHVNASGGIKALGGAKFEAVYGDNQMKPAVAATEAERLIEKERVAVVIGIPPSATILPASAVADRLKTPFLEPIGFADDLTRRGLKYFFEMQPTANYIAETQAKFLGDFTKLTGTKISRVGLLHEDTDYGKSLAKAQRVHLKNAGYELVADIEYNAKAPDLSSPVLKLKDARPDFVIQSSYFSDSLLIAKTAKRLGLAVPFLDAQGKGVAQYPKVAGPLAEGDFVLVQWNYDIPHALSQELARRYEERYKERPVHGVGAYFQAVLLVKRAIEMAGSADRDAVRNALSKVELLPGADLILPYEKITFDENGMNTYGRPMVTQIQDGQFVTIWPDRYATKKPKLMEGWKK
jgi:branched-chain amino acid transport system substrate-binding protein